MFRNLLRPDHPPHVSTTDKPPRWTKARRLVSAPLIGGLLLASIAATPAQAAPPLLTVTLAADSAKARPGDTVTYTATVTNDAEETASTVSVAPKTFTNGTLANLSAFVCDTATLPGGQTTTCTATYNLPKSAGEGSTQTLTVEGSITGEVSGETGKQTASVGLGIGHVVNAVYTNFTPNGFMSEGDIVKIVARVRTSPNDSVTNLHVEIDPDQWVGDGMPSDFTCAATTLAPNQLTTCTATYEITGADDADAVVKAGVIAFGTATGYKGTMSWKSDQGVLKKINFTSTHSATPSMVSKVGEVITWDVKVRNGWSEVIAGPSLTAYDFTGAGDTPTFTCEWDGATANPTTTPIDGNANIYPGSTIPCTATYTVTAADLELETIDLFVKAQGLDGSGTVTLTTAPAKASVSIPQQRATALVVASPDVITAAGQSITLTTTVTNTGNVTLADLAASLSGFTGKGTAPVFTCAPAELTPNQSATCTATYQSIASDLDLTELRGTVRVSARGFGFTTPITTAPSDWTVRVARQQPAPANPTAPTTPKPAPGDDKKGADLVLADRADQPGLQISITNGKLKTMTLAKPVISGSSNAATGSRVKVTVAGKVYRTKVQADGTWSVRAKGLAYGKRYRVEAVVTDRATGAASASVQYVRRAPAGPRSDAAPATPKGKTMPSTGARVAMGTQLIG